jgi:hypothetical protein
MIDNDGKCVGGFCDRAAREEAKRAQTQAVDSGHFGPHSPGVPPSDSPGRRLNGLGSTAGIAFQRGAPGKTFARMEILAILKSRKAILDGRKAFDGAVCELDALVDIFERME